MELTQFSITLKPVYRFAVKINWLVSIWQNICSECQLTPFYLSEVINSFKPNVAFHIEISHLIRNET